MKKFWISFIAILMGVVIGVGIWHGIAYKDKLETFAKESWETIKSAFVKKDDTKQPDNPTPDNPDQPTPDNPDNPPQEEINLDGFYYINVDGDITLVQVKGCSYGFINGYMQDSNIYFVDGWETNTEFKTFNTTEDEKYIHVYDHGSKVAIYDKATSTLYYDFSNGEQFPGETYEDQLLYEMVKFTDYIVCNEHEWVEDLSYIPTSPTCGEYWNKQFKCSKCHETKIEQMGPLEHDYVDGVCSRCGQAN